MWTVKQDQRILQFHHSVDVAMSSSQRLATAFDMDTSLQNSNAIMYHHFHALLLATSSSGIHITSWSRSALCHRGLAGLDWLRRLAGFVLT